MSKEKKMSDEEIALLYRVDERTRIMSDQFKAHLSAHTLWTIFLLTQAVGIGILLVKVLAG